MTPKPSKEQALSRRERQIMDAIYTAGSATAAQVGEALPDAPSNSAVRTLLRILVEKGHLRQKLEGHRYVYLPRQSRSKAARGALRRVVQTFYDGSIEDAVAGLIGSADRKLSDEQLDRLKQMINDARRKER